MRRHPRSAEVSKAKLNISEAICNAVFKYDLTYLELASILNLEMAINLKDALRMERHPNDSDKGADEE